ncbi:MAG: purine-binding chemotaxis protein CheW [Clostridiales bacterium]|nr:purine-binding chemotaxis protein CheW [Clostridiales bacterium]
MDYKYFEDEQEDVEETRSFLQFLVLNKRFAIPIEEVVEIASMDNIRPVPEFPDYVLGVSNVKGRNVAVIDARKRFKCPEEEKSPRQCLIIAKVERHEKDSEIGILVDDVTKFKELKLSEILPPPDVNNEAVTRYILNTYFSTAGEACFIVSPQLMMSLEEQDLIF